MAAEAIRHRRSELSDEEVDLLVSLYNYFRGMPTLMANALAATDRFVSAAEMSPQLFKLMGGIANRIVGSIETWGMLTHADKEPEQMIKILPEFAEDIEAINKAIELTERAGEPIRTLGIDIETYSAGDLLGGGVYKYVEDPSFTVLLFAYAINNGPVQLVSLAEGEVLPEDVYNALTDPSVLKTAFNAAFERICLSRYFGLKLAPAQWSCTMVMSAMAGYPMSLDAAGEALKLTNKKMKEGKALIRYFSLPCKATKANGGRTRNLPGDAPEKWDTFKRYCIRDVEVEQQIRAKLESIVTEIPSERQLYALDQAINDRGVQVDMDLVNAAIKLDTLNRANLNAEAVRLTGMSNPNSVAQLKAWLESETGAAIESLSKRDLPDMIKSASSDTVARMLSIRQEMAKTSVKKYEAMAKAVCEDGRVHGLLQFYGAARTGRWAGRLVQVQNLPQNHFATLGDLVLARDTCKQGDLMTMQLLYGNVPDTLSQLIRTAFVAKEGHKFIVCDFSAIEARVIAWLAGEQWRLEVFRTHGKIYEASASMMFHVPVEEITKTDPRRQKGKIAELALGYQGGVGAMQQMGGEKMGLSEAEMKAIVRQWRDANPAIVALWGRVEKAVKAAIRTRETTAVGCLRMHMRDGHLLIKLPSGRSLCYPGAAIGENRFGDESVTYMGVNQTNKQWCRLETYGGKLVENIVQGIARDCLAVTMLRMAEAGYPIVFHVHDEAISEVPENSDLTLEGVQEIFKTPIPWAEGLPLKGAGYETKFYLKD